MRPDAAFLAMLLQRREEIVAHLPTEHQLAVLRAVYASPHHHATSVSIAKDLGVSLPNASTQLLRLYRMGYLCREGVPDPSGGTKYVYWARIAPPA